MTTMLEKISEIAPRWRTRKVQQNKEWVAELDRLYPGVPLNIQIHSLVTNTDPFCYCGKPVKSIGKKTCSTKCRDLLIDHCARIKKQQATLLEKYGVENIRNIQGAEEKRAATMLEKYGALVSDITRSKAKERATELQRKGKETLKERYGVTNASQIQQVKDAKRNTSISKYGVSNISQRHISLQSLEILHNKALLEKFISGKNVLDAANLLGVNFTTVYKAITKFGIDGVKKKSSYEEEIATWLRSQNIEFIQNSKSILRKSESERLMELDFYFQDKQFAIEFNGLAHHSEFLGSDLRGGGIDFRRYHYEKWQRCNRIGIKLLSIFEDEWNKNKDIVKRKILHELGANVNNKTIGGRNVDIVPIIKKTEAIDFLARYHWQGAVKNFQIGYAAYYRNILIGVITFSKHNDTYELSRYCVGEVKCIGLFNKFLSRFIKDYSPSKIITFSDNRYADGKIYEKTGFRFDALVPPVYAVTNYVDRWHRNNFRKDNIKKKFNLDITNKTELQLLREDLGFDRVWDCGKKRWVWEK